MDERQKHFVKGSNPDAIWFHLFAVSRIIKMIGRESRMVVTPGKQAWRVTVSWIEFWAGMLIKVLENG